MALPKNWQRNHGIVELTSEGQTGQDLIGTSLNAVSVGHFRIHVNALAQDFQTSGNYFAHLAWGVGVADAELLNPLTPNASPGAWLAWGTIVLQRKTYSSGGGADPLALISTEKDVYETSEGMRRLDVGSPRFTAGLISEVAFSSTLVSVRWDVSMLQFLQPAE